MKTNRGEHRGRRVGTLTLGVTLVVMGVLFLLRLIGLSWLNPELIFRCWPVILILLGGEVLLSYLINKEEKICYDGWGIFLVFMMMGFAATMAALDLLFTYGRISGNLII